MPQGQKMMILGVGAQKAGTTWLFKALESSPKIVSSAIKEMHVFENHFSGRTDLTTRFMMMNNVSLGLSALIRNRQAKLPPKLLANMAAVQSYHDVQHYFDYFRSLDREDAAAFCEFTPEYALIPEAGWRDLKALLVQNNLRPRIIFIMRDPIERAWSAMNMTARQHKLTIDINFKPMDIIKRQVALDLNRYDKTITALTKVFAPNEYHFCFFETLFAPSEFGKITDFLDIEPLDAAFTTASNAAAVKLDIDTSSRAEMRALFDPVYSFCKDTFGSALPKSWHD